MNVKQKALRTKWGMASSEMRSLSLALPYIPKRYKRLTRMIKHEIEKLEKKIRETEKNFTYLGK
jgi:hypothetical protein